uniref:Aminotran_1_2 domain-containing protein n=1 Tax=Steinernema glaseri TaxID=37863 RepID=A0A1I7ZJX6_9BILA
MLLPANIRFVEAMDSYPHHHAGFIPTSSARISDRAMKGLSLGGCSERRNEIYAENPYHKENNPQGFIKLSSADNKLCREIYSEKWDSIDFGKFNQEKLMGYPRLPGEKETQATVAGFIYRFIRKDLPPINPDHIVLTSGVTSAFDALAHVLLNPGEVIFAPAPYYYRFPNDFGDRSLASVEAIDCINEESGTVELDVNRFQSAYERLLETGRRAKVVIITNPRNPDGGYHSLEEIKPIAEWAFRHNMFVIFNEIYQLSIYNEDKEAPFQSVHRLFSDLDSERFVWLWGTAKDLCIPGLRFGVIYTENADIRAALTKIAMFQVPNALTQFVVRRMLSDYEWYEKIFCPENRKRLRKCSSFVVEYLNAVGVRCMPVRAGFFIFADFAQFLDEPTFEAEERLNRRFEAHRILIVPGGTCKASKPGWFRIVFTLRDMDELALGLERICKALEIQPPALDGDFRIFIEAKSEGVANGV